eukprot:scaffold7395_cov229-Pinguiococcus_pyrenoidosus.AAC.1
MMLHAPSPEPPVAGRVPCAWHTRRPSSSAWSFPRSPSSSDGSLRFPLLLGLHSRAPLPAALPPPFALRRPLPEGSALRYWCCSGVQDNPESCGLAGAPAPRSSARSRLPCPRRSPADGSRCRSRWPPACEARRPFLRAGASPRQSAPALRRIRPAAGRSPSGASSALLSSESAGRARRRPGTRDRPLSGCGQRPCSLAQFCPAAAECAAFRSRSPAGSARCLRYDPGQPGSICTARPSTPQSVRCPGRLARWRGGPHPYFSEVEPLRLGQNAPDALHALPTLLHRRFLGAGFSGGGGLAALELPERFCAQRDRMVSFKALQRLRELRFENLRRSAVDKTLRLDLEEKRSASPNRDVPPEFACDWGRLRHRELFHSWNAPHFILY